MKKNKLMISALSVLAVLAFGFTGCSSSAGTGEAESSGAADSEGITVGGLWALTGFMDSYEVAGSEGLDRKSVV